MILFSFYDQIYVVNPTKAEKVVNIYADKRQCGWGWVVGTVGQRAKEGY